jgi:hippurate hydrolase
MLTAADLGLALAAPTNPLLAPLEPLYPSLEALYIDLHQHPELSLQERETSAKLAARLKALGYEVTTRVSGYGVVGSAPPAAFAEARSRGTGLPALHTSRMTPDRAPTTRMAVSTLTVSALELLGKP